MNASRCRWTRRRMLQATAAAVAAPMVVPARVLGAQAPSNRITVAMIGMGRQAISRNLQPFLHFPDTQVVAVCDVDRWRLEQAKAKVDKFYGNQDCQAYTDWRQVIERSDVDAVMNSTPDHWHVPISLAAVRAGKHVSCEKPLTLSVAEGRVLADAARRAGVVFRTDSECRSSAHMHKISELAINGYLGQLKHIEVGIPRIDVPGGKADPMPVPGELDYDMWLGPAPAKPYTVDRVHTPHSYKRPGWMRCRDTCQGSITNWGAHLLDIAQMGHQTDRTGPVSVEATGEYPPPGSGLWDVLLGYEAHMEYADGVTLHFASRGCFVRFEGDEGWVASTWLSQKLSASDEKLLHINLKDSDKHLPLRMDKEDFVHAIRTGEPTMEDAEVGHRTCSLGQIAEIAIRVGKKLRWDPQAERFDDEKANTMLSRSYRKPWSLEDPMGRGS